jgi:Cu/Ag efflux protein CusF
MARRLALFSLAALALVAVIACRERLAPADATYSARGQVVEMPASRNGEMTVHHESVPGFRDRKGNPSHMDSMAMPFAVADGVSLDGIADGDKVAFTFEVRWKTEPALRITRLEKLPADTALVFGGPTLELVAPLGKSASSSATPTPPTGASPSPTPASDGPAAPPPSSTI